MISSGGDDIQAGVETRSQSRRRPAVVTRRLVPLAVLVVLQCLLPAPTASVIESCWKGLSNVTSIISDGDTSVAFHDCSSFLVVVVSDQFSKDPAVTSISATGHQLVTLCWSNCAEERAKNLQC